MIRGDDNLFQTLRQLVPSETANPWDPPAFEYDLSLQIENASDISSSAKGGAAPLRPPFDPFSPEPPMEFRALISIPHFPIVLDLDAKALQKRREVPPEKRGGDITAPLRREPGLTVECIGCDRAWALEIGANHLTLSLNDGRAAHVEASMVIIADDKPSLRVVTKTTPDESNPFADEAAVDGPPQRVANHETGYNVPGPSNSKTRPAPTWSNSAPAGSAVLLQPINSGPPPRPPRAPRPPRSLKFPPTTLHPLSSSGTHRVTLSPCFPAPSSFITSVSTGPQELLVELTVKLTNLEDPRKRNRPASVGGRSFMFFTEAAEQARSTQEQPPTVVGSPPRIKKPLPVPTLKPLPVPALKPLPVPSLKPLPIPAVKLEEESDDDIEYCSPRPPIKIDSSAYQSPTNHLDFRPQTPHRSSSY